MFKSPPHARKLGLAALALVGVGLLLMAIDRMIGNVPVQFFGLVTDSNGRALSGVRVVAKVNVVSWEGNPLAPRYSGNALTTETDADGRFEFRAWRGNRLDIQRFEKPAWKLVATPLVGVPTNFSYPPRSSHSPGTTREFPMTYAMAPDRTAQHRTNVPSSGPGLSKP
jgi:hypothetical protein